MGSPIGPTPLEGRSSEAEQIAWLLTDAITRLRRILRSSVRSDYPWETLPMAQVEVLQRLDENPGIRITDLARRHRLATNTVSTLIQQMVAAGLVTRDPDPGDRRAVVINPTEEGRAVFDGWRRANEQRLQEALNRLPGTDRDALGAALPALLRLASELERGDEADPGDSQDSPTAGADSRTARREETS